MNLSDRMRYFGFDPVPAMYFRSPKAGFSLLKFSEMEKPSGFGARHALKRNAERLN